MIMKKLLTENLDVSKELRYHLDRGIPISKNVFRTGSEKFFEVINEARRLWDLGLYENLDDEFLMESDIGEWDIFEGEEVPLDFPMVEAEYQGRDVELNKPKRGGSKKFYVYVKDPDSGNVRKVAFGAQGGGGKLSVKFKDPERRKAFADRHDCKNKKDKTKAGYWSCRLPRYAKSLGLGNNMNTYW